MRSNCCYYALTLAVILSASANAQWTVVNLHPAGAAYSVALGVQAGQQVGWAGVGAAVWSGSAATWVDLNPAGSDYSAAYGVHGGQQVGYISSGGVLYASLWTGTATSWVNLNPVDATRSRAFGMDAGQQVGYAEVGGVRRASLWSGTAASWVDLHPAGASESTARGIQGGQQVGNVRVSGVFRACLWSGAAASWVDLHPGGASESIAYGIHGGQQVGYSQVGGALLASLWCGTAASWVDLNPAVSVRSFALSVDRGQQAGIARVAGVDHACLWSGTAASWVDLHAFLPAEFNTTSGADGIWHDASSTYVVGHGYNSVTGRDEALIWVGPNASQTITATTTTLAPGTVFGGVPAYMGASDDVYYTLRPGAVLTTAQSPIVLTASYTLPAASAGILRAVVESRASQSNIRQTVEAYNFSTSNYQQLNQQVLPSTSPDTVVEWTLYSPANYIGPGNEVRLRISYKAMGALLIFPWRVFVDEMTVRYSP